jgi:hypothetical protein
MDTDYIIKNVDLIIIDLKNGIHFTDITQKYSEFFEKYPSIVKLCCKGGMNRDELMRMLKERDSVLSGKKTQEEVEMRVGHHMFHKFIRDKMTDEQIEDLINVMYNDFVPMINYIKNNQNLDKDILKKNIENEYSELFKKYYNLPYFIIDNNITNPRVAKEFLKKFYTEEKMFKDI